MELKSTIDIILKDLEEAQSIIDELKKYPGVPVLKAEMARAKCRSAVDVIKVLGDIVFPDPVSAADISDEPEMGGEKEIESVNVIKEQRDVETDTGNEETGKQLQSEHDLAESETGDVSGSEAETHLRIEQDNEKKIIADRFNHLSSRINEKIAGTRKENGQSDHSRARPVNDLKEAIGINDRYYFVKEVFDTNQDLYGRVLDELNSAPSIEKAREIIAKSASESASNEAIELLMEVVKRKVFPKADE